MQSLTPHLGYELRASATIVAAPSLDFQRLQKAVQHRERDSTPVPDGQWPTVGKDGTAYLSPSARSLYSNCTQAYRYRYIERLPSKPSPDATMGTFLHAVMEQALQAQIAGQDWTGPELGAAVQDAAESVAPHVAPEVAVRFETETDAMVRAAVKAWSLWHARNFTPVEVERRRTVYVGDLEVHGLGVMDILANTPDGLAVIDWKFPRKGAWDRAQIHQTPLGEMIGDMREDHMLACSLYADAAQAEHEEPVRWIATISSPRSDDPAYLTGMRWDRDRTMAVHAAWGQAIQGIRAGRFIPKARAKWLCNQKFCDYWSVCPGGGGPPA